ncbi:MAG: Ig-like domain-containing protein [Flavobacteriales bacterium]|nr:Ig-like domain-containing protein [Flavobacteriales bacterium]
MKKFKYTSKINSIAAALLVAFMLGCERELSDDISLANYPNTPEVFTDFPVSLTDQFFISYDPADGANVNGFDVDNNAYKGSSAIRIDVPGSEDPEGSFIGGIFKDRFRGRDLTKYDALTFWAKGTTTASIGLFGFGTDFDGDKFNVGMEEINLTTTWTQYVIPFPDPAKLVQEKGMFAFSAGTDSTDGLGYTFWMDEIRFQKLGYFTQPRPTIYDGMEKEVIGYTGSEIDINETELTLSLGNGSDVTVSAAAAYFDYTSSDTAVATVDEDGVVTVLDIGTSTITASLNGVDATGSLIIESKGFFELAPIPTHAAENVISIFSDAYENVKIDFYNGYWKPYQTTTSADFVYKRDNILAYENFNFVGQQFTDPLVDASEMTHFHLNVFIPNDIKPNDELKITIKDYGPNKADNGGRGDDMTQVVLINSSQLTSNGWASVSVPLTFTTGTGIGQIIYENSSGASKISTVFLDNIYFFKE